MKQDDINVLRDLPLADQQLWIAGQHIPAHNGSTLPVISPINGQQLCDIAAADAVDVDRAVQAARRQFIQGAWTRMSPAERKKILHRIADLVEQHQSELAVMGVRDNGTEISMAYKAEPGSCAATFRYYAECIDKLNGDITPTAANTLGLVHREPVGVVGAIVPWNFPLMIGSWKIAPALAMGNCVVLKPSEEASLSLLRLAEICQQAGLPDGALNVVTGTGAVAGEALARHTDVDVLAFTGSGAVGRQLLKASAESNLKRVYLELGGKSPNIVFADAPDLAHAARVSAQGIFRNSGQVCVAGSRLLVERSVHDEFVLQVCQAAEKMQPGDPLDVNTAIGAIVSERQLQRIQAALQTAVDEGAQLRCGGQIVRQETGGFYMSPAVLTGVQPHMRIAREEVFGPVLAVMPFDDEAQAISLANDSDYGLAAGVWTSNLSRAHRMVRAVQAGVVHVNTYGGADLTVPLGGVKQSGNGHDKSMHALSHYTNLKTAWIQL